MSVNDLTFNQIATVMNTIAAQATGAATITPVNTGEFVSVAQTALKTGVDPVMNAISQVLSRTIFSVRPYYRKFADLRVSSQRYGNHVRKLQISDGEMEDAQDFKLVEDGGIDQYKVKKPNVLQTNFYGQNVSQVHYTIFKDQLNSAFSGPDQFAEFLSMVMQNVADMIEQDHEAVARMTLANLIGGKIEGDAANVVHLVTEFNTVTAAEPPYTPETILKPDIFVEFMKWAYARISTISDYMTERSQLYHINVTGHPINRHTPKELQKLYLFSPTINQMESTVLSSVFNERFLQIGAHEKVNFWQSIKSPDTINVKPTYLLPSGELKTSSTGVNKPHVAGVLFDIEAAGYTTVNEWSAPTPFNAAGGYSNVFFHFTDRYWNDFSENAVVFLFD